MRKISLLICLSVFLSCCFLRTHALAEEESTYTNPVLKFSVLYPKDWELNTEKDVVFVKKIDGQSVLLMHSTEDLGQEPVNLEQAFNRYDSAMMKGGYQLTDQGPVSIGDHVGMFKKYEDNDPNRKAWNFPHKAYAFIKGTTLYSFIYQAPPEMFDQYLPTAEKIIYSYSEQ